MPHEHQLKPPSSLVVSVAAVLIAVIVGLYLLIVGGTTFPQDPTGPLVAPSSGASQGINPDNCGAVAADQVQTCCQAWVEKYELMVPQCIGSWSVENELCTYTCDVSDGEVDDGE